MPKIFKFFGRVILFSIAFMFVAAFVFYLQTKNTNETLTEILPTSQFSLPNDLDVKGDLKVNGSAEFLGKVKLSSQAVPSDVDSRVLAVDNDGYVYSTDEKSLADNYYYTTNNFPNAFAGEIMYYNGIDWDNSSLFHIDESSVGWVGIGTTDPLGKLHVDTSNSDTMGLVLQGVKDQSADLMRWLDSSGSRLGRIAHDGKLVLENGADHLLEVRASGNTGYLSSSGGAIFVENTYNNGTGIGIDSNAGSDAEGNMINVKVDNSAFNQAAFYMNYDGISNAVEIVANTNDTSSNALSVTNYNTQDSAVGIKGYEAGRGTIKVSHIKNGSDTNASGISIDLQGTGTAAQGLYVDSTATGGTTGNLLRLRNQSIDRFVVDYLGGVKIGRNGTNTSITKYGNTSGDEFYVGTNAAFRVQRSATDSEAFRTQIVGDTQGRWLGTADGKLKFGDGSNPQDVVMQRKSVGLMQLQADMEIDSQSTDNDVLKLVSYDSSVLANFSETVGGQGVLEINNANGAAEVMLRGDSGNSYILDGNFGLGTTSTGTSANKVFAFGNGTAPTTSITNGVQLWAEDVASSSELRVRDEAGNVSTLSPHDFSLIPGGPSEDMAWAFYSVRGDLAINADIAKALRILENLSGQKLIYIKNLDTGNYVEETHPDYSNKLTSVSDDQMLKQEIDDALKNYLSKDEFEKHVSLGEKIWSFISDVTFKAKAIFESSVEFLANATFKGSITVNADTAGEVIVPANTQKFRVKFSKSFSEKPIVYVNSEDNLDYEIATVDKDGFEVQIKSVSDKDVKFSWLALMSENGDLNRLEVLESSSENPQTEVVSTPTPTPAPTLKEDDGVLEEKEASPEAAQVQE
jgi:hypothetical protein